HRIAHVERPIAIHELKGTASLIPTIHAALKQDEGVSSPANNIFDNFIAQVVLEYGQGGESSPIVTVTGRCYTIPFPFPDMMRNRGVNQAEWLESYVLAGVLLRLRQDNSQLISVNDISAKAEKAFADHMLPFTAGRFVELLEGLRRRGLIRNATNGAFDIETASTESVVFDLDPRLVASWADDTDYIQHDLKKVLKAGRNEFLRVIDLYAQYAQQWNMYPVEAKYPVLRAVTLMNKKEHEQMVSYLLSRSQWERLPLVDAVLLMLDPEKAQVDWLASQAPQLLHRSIYFVAAEISLLAGGLGRVMQYHGTGMHQLGADIICVEPYYRKHRDKTGAVHPLDYTDAKAVPLPVKDVQKLNNTFSTFVQGKYVTFEVYTAINGIGVLTYLIRDLDGKFVNILYEYGTDESPASNYEFTEFFTKAALELMRYLELEKKHRLGSDYKAPLVDCNDGQVLPLAAWRKIFYSDASNIIHEGVDDKNLLETYEIFKDAIFCGTTHTYRNRVMIQDFEYGKRFLKAAGVPDEWLWVFLRDEFGTKIWDFTSAGVRCADVAKAVSAVHGYEMNMRDPAVQLFGVTNGDNRPYSSEFFRAALKKHDIDEYEYVTPEQVAIGKRQAKEDSGFGLNPDQMVISYSGRLVPEKAGRLRAFTDANIEAWVKAGIQVVIFGNVQPYEDSRKIGQDLERLQERLSQAGYAGKFIFRGKFNIDDQRRLLAASDIQIQDSDRYTGASEYTEADVSANAGLQMGAPFWEGIIQRQGLAINKRAQSGNTLIPATTSDKDYRNIVFWANEEFQKGALSIYQAQSVRLSRYLGALVTAAEYLRLWNSAIFNHQVSPAKPRVCGEVAVEDVSLVAYTAEGAKDVARNNGDIFVLDGDQKSELELTVKIDLKGWDAVSYGKNGIIPFDMVRADLVNDFGIRLPLCIKRRIDNHVEFYTKIPADLPLPMEGEMEVTSGVWKMARAVKFLVNTAAATDAQPSYPDDVSSAARNLTDKDLQKLAGIGNVNQTRAAPSKASVPSVSSPITDVPRRAKISIFGSFVRGLIIAALIFGAAICLPGCKKELPPKQTVEHILERMNDPVFNSRLNQENAAKQLVSIKKEAIRVLVEKIRNPDESARRRALEALALMGRDAQDAVPALMGVFTDSSLGGTDIEVVQILGKIGPSARAALPLLLEALKSNRYNPELGPVLVKAIMSMDPDMEIVVPLFVDILKYDGVKSPFGEFLSGFHLCTDIVDALDRLGWEPQTKEEKEAYEEVKTYRKVLILLQQEDFDTLQEMGETAFPFLVIELGHHDYRTEEYRRVVERAIIKIGRPIVPHLAKVIGFNYFIRVQEDIYEVLRKMGKDAEEAVPTLINILQHRDGSEIEHVREILVSIGKPALPALKSVDQHRERVTDIIQQIESDGRKSVVKFTIFTLALFVVVVLSIARKVRKSKELERLRRAEEQCKKMEEQRRKIEEQRWRIRDAEIKRERVECQKAKADLESRVGEKLVVDLSLAEINQLRAIQDESVIKAIPEVLAKLRSLGVSESYLLSALGIRREGYDFEVKRIPGRGHFEEEGHWEDEEDDVYGYWVNDDGNIIGWGGPGSFMVGYDYYQTPPDAHFVSNRKWIAESVWVVDEPERIEIVKTTPLKQGKDSDDSISSPISNSQVRDVLTFFGIRQVYSINELEGGIGSRYRPLLIRTDSGEFVLRRINKTRDQARFIISFINRLKSAGLPVPAMHKKAGVFGESAMDYIVASADAQYVLEEFLIQGRSVRTKNINERNYRSMAALAANINNAMENFTPEGEKTYKSRSEIIAFIMQEMARFKGQAERFERNDPDVESFFSIYPFILMQNEIFVRRFEAARAMGLRKAPVYNDLHAGNVKFNDQDVVVALFDFDFAMTDDRVIEFNNLILGRDDLTIPLPYNYSKMKAIIRTYNEFAHIRLSEGEIRAIIEILRLRFMEDLYGRFVRHNEFIPMNVFDNPWQLGSARQTIELFYAFADDFSSEEKINNFVYEEVFDRSMYKDQSSSPSLVQKPGASNQRIGNVSSLVQKGEAGIKGQKIEGISCPAFHIRNAVNAIMPVEEQTALETKQRDVERFLALPPHQFDQSLRENAKGQYEAVSCLVMMSSPRFIEEIHKVQEMIREVLGESAGRFVHFAPLEKLHSTLTVFVVNWRYPQEKTFLTVEDAVEMIKDGAGSLPAFQYENIGPRLMSDLVVIMALKTDNATPFRLRAFIDSKAKELIYPEGQQMRQRNIHYVTIARLSPQAVTQEKLRMLNAKFLDWHADPSPFLVDHIDVAQVCEEYPVSGTMKAIPLKTTPGTTVDVIVLPGIEEFVNTTQVVGLDAGELTVMKQLVKRSSYLAHAPPVGLVVTSRVIDTLGRIFAISKDRSTLYILHDVLSIASLLNETDQQTFLIFLAGLVDGHEVPHIRGLDEREARLETIKFYKAHPHIWQATCQVLASPDTFKVAAVNDEFSAFSNELNRELSCKLAGTTDTKPYGLMSTRKWLAHPNCVACALAGKFYDMVPPTVQYAPSVICQYRCPTCSYGGHKDSMRGHKFNRPEMVASLEDMRCIIQRIAEAGIKAITFTGGGEPFTNDHTIDGIEYARQLGLHVGLFSNGLLVNRALAERIFRTGLSFFRISFNAGTPETYKHSFGASKRSFFVVLKNLRSCLAAKLAANSQTVFGLGVILSPLNVTHLMDIACIVRSIADEFPGALNYIAFRPTVRYKGGCQFTRATADSLQYVKETPDLQRFYEIYRAFLYDEQQYPRTMFEEALQDLETRVKPFLEQSTAPVQVLLPRGRLEGVYQTTRPVSECLSCGLTPFIGPDGTVYHCVELALDRGLAYGTLLEQPFINIWSGEQRRRMIQKVNSGKLSHCPPVCMLYEYNLAFHSLRASLAEDPIGTSSMLKDEADKFMRNESVSLGEMVNFMVPFTIIRDDDRFSSPASMVKKYDYKKDVPVATLEIDPKVYQIHILVASELEGKMFPVDRRTNRIRYKDSVAGEVINVGEDIRQKVPTVRALIDRFKTEHPAVQIFAVTGNENLFYNTPIITVQGRRLYHATGVDIMGREYPMLVAWEDGSVTIEKHVIFEFEDYEKKIVKVLINGKEEVVRYATAIQLIRHGNGFVSPATQAYFYDDVKHLFSMPRFDTNDLSGMPTGLMSEGVFFMADQLLADNGRHIKEYFDSQKPQEFNLQILLSGKNNQEIVKKVPARILEDKLLKLKYKSDDFSINESAGTINIRLRENLYPFHMMGVTENGLIKEIAINGISGLVGVTVREAADIAEREGLVSAGIVDQGKTVRLDVLEDENFVPYGNAIVDRNDKEGQRASSLIVYARGSVSSPATNLKSLLNASDVARDALDAHVLIILGNDNLETFREALHLYQEGKTREILATGGRGPLTEPMIRVA
ncbi:MAG: radical SAM protein, partial [Candidatus Omnitrophota bacterium]